MLQWRNSGELCNDRYIYMHSFDARDAGKEMWDVFIYPFVLITGEEGKFEMMISGAVNETDSGPFSTLKNENI